LELVEVAQANMGILVQILMQVELVLIQSLEILVPLLLVYMPMVVVGVDIVLIQRVVVEVVLQAGVALVIQGLLLLRMVETLPFKVLLKERL
jgi:hypothetical protein